MEDFTLDDLDADMLDFFKDDIELRQPPVSGEFTADAFAKQMNLQENVDITDRIARTWLDKAVKEDKATMRVWRSDKGHDTKLYKWMRGGK